MRSTDDGVSRWSALDAALESPSALLAHGDHLYAVIEGPGEGFVQSWRRTGTVLELDGVAPAGGTFACDLAVFEGRLIVTNYGNGVLGVVGLDAAGAVTTLLQAIPGPGAEPGPPSRPGQLAPACRDGARRRARHPRPRRG